MSPIAVFPALLCLQHRFVCFRATSWRIQAHNLSWQWSQWWRIRGNTKGSQASEHTVDKAYNTMQDSWDCCLLIIKAPNTLKVWQLSIASLASCMNCGKCLASWGNHTLGQIHWLDSAKARPKKRFFFLCSIGKTYKPVYSKSSILHWRHKQIVGKMDINISTLHLTAHMAHLSFFFAVIKTSQWTAKWPVCFVWLWYCK